jgi:hypothetical protein
MLRFGLDTGDIVVTWFFASLWMGYTSISRRCCFCWWHDLLLGYEMPVIGDIARFLLNLCKATAEDSIHPEG